MECPNDNTLAAFANGRLPRAKADTLAEHVRICSRCGSRLSYARAVNGAATETLAQAGGLQVRPRDPSGAGPTDVTTPDDLDVDELERGAPIGRYTILGLVGRGGMGHVYAAYDPELDRKIALKLLGAARSNARAQARLLREAKAIARLSHANVVVVHDAGTFANRVFVAMEFVEGETLKEWLAAAPRSRREILDVFESAARGLHAAHVAGLVHRDFKPHNVMVSREGGVRVMDFGLARQVDGDVPDEASDEPANGDAPVAETDLTFTRTGELVGTPLYMAPEQFLATRTDARTDQFSFCVALYRALYGAHPFSDASLDSLVGGVVAGLFQPPPAKHDVPSWLRRVLLRGLSASPADRWPSMAALIDALEQDPARARRRWAAAAAVTLLVGAAAVTLVRGPRRSEAPCVGGPARLAGVWEPPGAARPRRDAVAAAFLRAPLPSARATWTRVEAGLDRYAASWLGMYRDACEATHVRGEQSPETLDLRMACLEERRTALGALTDVLTSADAVAVSSAVNAVGGLPPVDACADVKSLREPTDSPRDPATRARAEDLRARLATARALHDTGRHEEGLTRVRGVVAEARTLGYRSLLAEALDAEGEMYDGSSFDPECAKLFEEAVWTALAVRRDDLAARATTWLVSITGYYLSRFDEGERWARMSSALLDRLGPGHDILRAWLLHGEANIKLQQDDAEGALSLYTQDLALKEKVLPAGDPDIAATISAIAEALHRVGRDGEALEMTKRAYDVDVRAYGPDAADLARLLSNEGEYLVALGRPKDAVPVFQDSLRRFGNTGPESPLLAYPLTGLGQAWLLLGRPDEARPVLEHALRERQTGGDSIDTAETQFALARALWDSANARPRARELAAAARDAYVHAGDRAPSKTREDRRKVEAWLAAHG